MVVDEGHTVSKVTQDSEPAFFWFDMLARVHNVHTTSRVFNDAPRAVDGIREDHEAKVPGVVLHGSAAATVMCPVFSMTSLESATRDPQSSTPPRYLISVSSPRVPSTMLSGSSMGHEKIKKPSESNGSPQRFGSMNRCQHVSVPGLYLATLLVHSPYKSRFPERTHLQTGILLH